MLLLCGLVWCLVTMVSSEHILQALQRNADLSKFYEIVKKDVTVGSLLSRKSVTVFAPINSAVNESDLHARNMEEKVASYHILIQLADKSIFPSSVSTFLSGAAPLFLTYRFTDSGEEVEKEFFVNNAKIQKEIEYSTDDGSKQLLYIIDEVLEPYVPTTGYPPNALQFLNQPGIYDIQSSVGAFAGRVRSENEGREFEKVGNHTFFLPVGAANEYGNAEKLKDIDAMVIRGHVIPNQVLFTRTMGGKAYKTDSYTQNLKVEISLVNGTSSSPTERGFTLRIKSNTLQSDHRHKKGVVLSRVLQANIPVKNGVVHLIEAPLMIIDINIWSFIRQEQEGRLSEFSKLLHHAANFRYLIQGSAEKTLFAPNNEAIRRLSDDNLRDLQSNDSAITNLLNFHVVMGSVSSDDVKSERITELLSGDERRKLYFRVVGDDRNRTLSVQGGGVNALAVQADIGATDGIIHIIDRVLGMPYLTVYETLKETESYLNETYQLSNQDEWNSLLASKDQKFTFFAPSNGAWQDLAKDMPTTYKQLKLGLYPQYISKIMERHLVAKKELSTKDLEKMDQIQTVNSLFKIERGHTSDKLYVVWEGFRAEIILPDVKATNGVIHIINHVMMKSRDFVKSSAAVISSLAMTILSTALVLLLVVGNKL